MQRQKDLKLTISDLAASRGENQIFSGKSFSLHSGEAIVITGHNGSGKSTFLRVLAGLLPSDSGSIVLEPQSEIPFHEHCHYLGHLNALKPALSVEENLFFWQRFCGDVWMEVDEALATVGLAGIGHLPASCLSAGQKRRVAIARLLVARKPVWLVDEPTAALDARSARQFEESCKEHLQQGGILIAATHQPLDIGPHQSLVFGESG